MIRVPLRRRRADVDGRLDASVEELATLLAREERARAEFIGKVSHELRTPLTVIKGYVYTLHRSEHDPGKAAKLDVIDGECERLGYLIEDLLELSRARAGELRVNDEVFPLEPCVSEVAERLQTVAEQGGVRVRLDWTCNGGLVRGDQNRVRQIFNKPRFLQRRSSPQRGVTRDTRDNPHGYAENAKDEPVTHP